MHDPDLHQPVLARREREAGLTLIEVILTAAVMGSILVGTAQFAKLAADATQTTTETLTEMRFRAENVRELRDTLSRALVRQISPDGETTQFSLPVPLGQGGSFIDANGQMLFGTRGPEGPILDDSYILRFVSREILREPELGRDLNLDGDMNDSFELGQMEIATQSGIVVNTLQVPVIRPEGDPGGDINGDALPDPLVSIDGLTLTITLAYPNQAGYIAIWTSKVQVSATSV